MRFTPKSLKRLLNVYPPYLGAGIRIQYVSDDWKELHVGMPLRWYNRNAVNTHFGGSLYSMVDPHLMLLLMQLLGRDYLIWDKAADIEFVKAGKKKVTSVIRIEDGDLEDIKHKTAGGEKYLPEFTIDVVDEANELIARVRKTLYVRKKNQD
ncbi:DUF4442 domain-containing protein [Marinobacter confluentis]|uniref:DUF4442 domain-containing protein n=1 Tax=Marinobacter confluentis TaxID=1697557 RepID=A0A4Z1BTA7_9GAMM|nr:DUF4442 domain-containing protein [Marinobacter confluentis]TGN40449.1 DUF4442 domain-containing protein [Marinobacter confluentis]